MTTIAPAFDCFVQYQIGHGSGTKFWYDNWHDTPLKYSFPNLYSATLDKQPSVNQCINGNNWVIQAPTLNSLAQAEKNTMMLNLQDHSTTYRSDLIKWIRNSSNFSVSSAYQFLTQTPGPTSALYNIWNIKAPLRVSVFTWLMLSNRLATIDNLVKRGWQIPNMCVLCNSEEENVPHMFQHCLLSKQIRNFLYATFSAHLSIPAKFNSADSSHMLIDPKENKTVRQWETVTCFVIWRERYRRIFSDKTVSHIELVREVRMEYNSWFT